MILNTDISKIIQNLINFKFSLSFKWKQSYKNKAKPFVFCVFARYLSGLATRPSPPFWKEKPLGFQDRPSAESDYKLFRYFLGDSGILNFAFFWSLYISQVLKKRRACKSDRILPGNRLINSYIKWMGVTSCSRKPCNQTSL